MVEASRSLPQASTKYWVDVILTTAWHAKRFDCEPDALAHAQVYARFPNACSVVAYAYTPEGRKIIFDWSEAEVWFPQLSGPGVFPPFLSRWSCLGRGFGGAGSLRSAGMSTLLVRR
jgi:hypothetical protein